MKTVIRDTPGFLWLDLLNPTSGEIENLAKAHGIPTTAVQDCLDARHLPKYESLGKLHFVILRAYDAESPPDSDTVQELTRKLALFFSETLLLSVHRTGQNYITNGIEQEKSDPAPGIAPALIRLISRAMDTYSAPIELALNELDELESAVFESDARRPFQVRKAYLLKRRASVMKRMLRHTSEVLGMLEGFLSALPNEFQDLLEKTERLRFFADELEDGVTILLNLHLSISSQRTNEVMRVLTIFSAFILPLSVVTGIYGMNFKQMPELEHPFGYPTALILMAGIELAIYLAFRRKGWLK